MKVTDKARPEAEETEKLFRGTSAVQARHSHVLDAAYHAHPERFVSKPHGPTDPADGASLTLFSPIRTLRS
jgi:hypothetical protein